jgi:hypothetical protein
MRASLRTRCGRELWWPPRQCGPVGWRRGDGPRRQPQVCSDAAYAVLTRPARSFAGRSLLCEDVLFASGITDLSAYDCAPNSELQLDFWVAGPYPHH